MIYLYLKIHNTTGLKYLGKTTRDPFTYKGSGKYWLSHLKKYGYDVTTKILFTSCDKEVFSKVAKEYSRKYNIVESEQFANLAPEEGQGGYTVYTEERNKKIAQGNKGKKRNWSIIPGKANIGMVTCIDTNDGQIKKVSKSVFDINDNLVGIGKLNKGKTYKKNKKYSRVSNTVICPHCNKSGATNNMTRYHFDNCKNKDVHE